MDPVAIVYAALADDSALALLLADYASEAAIFSGDLPPPDFTFGELPCVLIRPPNAETNFDTLDTFSRSVDLDVFVYAAPAHSSQAVEDAASRVRAVLHRQYLAAQSGERNPLATVTGPLGAPTSDASVTGRRLSVRLDLHG